MLMVMTNNVDDMKIVTLLPYQTHKHPMLVDNLPPLRWITLVSVCF